MAFFVQFKGACNCARVDSVLMCEVRTNFGVGQQTFPLFIPEMLKISQTPLVSSMGGWCGSKATSDLMSLGHKKNLASLISFSFLSSSSQEVLRRRRNGCGPSQMQGALGLPLCSLSPGLYCLT